jgi:hypothetical protein
MESIDARDFFGCLSACILMIREFPIVTKDLISHNAWFNKLWVATQSHTTIINLLYGSLRVVKNSLGDIGISSSFWKNWKVSKI